MIFKLQILYILLYLKVGKLLMKYKLAPVHRLRMKQLLRTLRQSPYYQPFLANAVDVSSFPIINKSGFMEHFDTINTRGLHKEQCMEVAIQAEQSRDFSPMIQGISVGLSTGTSGNRGLFLVSARERALWVATVLDRVIGFSLRKRKAAFFLRANNNLYQSSQSRLLHFSFFDIYLPMEQHLAKLQQFQPDIIVAQPSVLCRIADAILQGNLQLSTRKIFSVAEVLTPEDQLYLEQAFQQKIHQVYQCTEGFLAASCKHGTLHFNEDFLLIEKKYINTEKTKFHPIITDLLRSTQPVVRYELNDIITGKTSCPCGSKWLAIESIEGRSDDILIFENTRHEQVQLFPDLFRRNIVLADTRVTDYCLIQSQSHLLQLYVRSESQDSYPIVARAISDTLNSYNIINVTIEKRDSDPFVLGNKKRRIRNEIPKTN